jgi:hypothetical protein
VSAQDYYPFGMLQPGRFYLSATGNKYRYGFNGKENDNEVNKFDKLNVNTLVSIVHHFAHDASLDTKMLYNKDVSVGSLDDLEGENLPILNKLYNDPGNGIGELMSTNKGLDRLNVTLDNGKLSWQLNTSENLISTLFHEKTHLDTEEGGVWEHLDVYYKQISHRSWKNTTDAYKDNIIKNIKELINTAKGGNANLPAKDNAQIKLNAKKWEEAFMNKLGSDYEKFGNGDYIQNNNEK